MKYYKVKTAIKDGHIQYGELPKDFVLGYEDRENNVAYVELDDSIELPSKIGFTSITKNQYESAVSALSENNQKKTAEEQEKMIEELLENKKNNEQVIEGLKKRLTETETVVLALLDNQMGAM